MERKAALKKIFLAFGFFILLVLIVFVLSRGKIYPQNELSYGVTFSEKQATDLGLDWKQTYSAILDDLGVKKLRLSAYWDEVEPERGDFEWQDLDWQIDQASSRKAQVILALGGRLPRWPECHWPGWAGQLDEAARGKEILTYIEQGIDRYKNNPTIVAWQIENEPFLSHFGECPSLDKNFLDQEIALARRLDPRPIVITDSGELSIWIPAASRADIFGTTMYRDTYSKVLGRYIHYPIGPSFFRFKKNIASFFAHPKKWVVIELQAEPWGPISYQDMTEAERDRTMDLQKFKAILAFAREAGFREFYLWGAEWWYWEKQTQHNPALWAEAKTLFNSKTTISNSQ